MIADVKFFQQTLDRINQTCKKTTEKLKEVTLEERVSSKITISHWHTNHSLIRSFTLLSISHLYQAKQDVPASQRM